MNKKLLIVSNRLPVKLSKKDSQIEVKISEGGLATGLNSLKLDYKRKWVGWPGIVPRDDKEKAQIENQLEKGLVPVFLTNEEVNDYYEGFSNETIWPLFHYFNEYASYERKYWEAYVAVNKKFCEKVSTVAGPEDIIWVQDYQLMLLPQMLREQFPDQQIGFFLHIPFPSYEVFRILPWRTEILKGMLGADLVAFHTYEYMRHFSSSVYRILGYENRLGELTVDDRMVYMDIFPMGINYEKYHNAIEHPEVQKQIEKFRPIFGESKVVFAVDRLDYSKGILQRLEALDTFFTEYPEYKEKVTHYMIVAPSRSGVEQYRALKEEVDEAVGSLNGKHATINWTPVHYIYRSANFEQLAALYSLADICLITSLRDGMNLVAKEYVAVKRDQPGVLILSELAGSVIELEGALKINPNSIYEVVNALIVALKMPEAEQKQRIEFMQQRIKKQTIQKWARDFIHTLGQIQQVKQSIQKILVNGPESNYILEKYRTSKKSLLLLDYDGTLVPFTEEPEHARPDEDTIGLIKEAAENNTVVIISGRDHYTLDNWFGQLNVELIAEHGTWHKEKGKWKLVKEVSDGWKEDVLNVLQEFTERTPGSFIEQKPSSLAWHYRKTDAWLTEMRVPQLVQSLTQVCTKYNLEIIEGKKIIEITISGIDKGSAVYQWVQREDWDFILAMGDDSNNEEIFKILPDSAVTIKIGYQPTSARFRIRNPAEAKRFLKTLAEVKKVPERVIDYEKLREKRGITTR